MPKKEKPELLLHICCAGCGAYVGGLLAADYRVTLYFYNPNLSPEAEYGLRLKETARVAGRLGLDLIAEEYDHKPWLEKIAGFEAELEKGQRCVICYADRLEKTAVKAQSLGKTLFASTLTVSPHKKADIINQIGRSLGEKYGLRYLTSDFKKADGFKKAASLSRALGLYRQDYCGCEFSRGQKGKNHLISDKLLLLPKRGL